MEKTTHIPITVRVPGVETGSTCTQPVSLIDVYPSLVDFAGLEIPERLSTFRARRASNMWNQTSA